MSPILSDDGISLTGPSLIKNDGLIFTVDACPYYPGTCNEIIKWKPPHMNSIDFEMKPLGQFRGDRIWGLCVQDR